MTHIAPRIASRIRATVLWHTQRPHWIPAKEAAEAGNDEVMVMPKVSAVAVAVDFSLANTIANYADGESKKRAPGHHRVSNAFSTRAARH